MSRALFISNIKLSFFSDLSIKNKILSKVDKRMAAKCISGADWESTNIIKAFIIYITIIYIFYVIIPKKCLNIHELIFSLDHINVMVLIC